MQQNKKGARWRRTPLINKPKFINHFNFIGMSHKSTENQTLAQDYAGIRMIMKMIDFASWKWLAATTAIMVYSAFYSSVSLWVPPGLRVYVLLLIVAIFYLVIDHGLPETLERFIRGRKTLEQHQQVIKAHKKLLSLFILLFIVRLCASGLASVWAGGEIGDLTTEDFNSEKYIASAALRDSTDGAKLAVATNELSALRASEDQRIAQATAKGKREIAAAVKTGNSSQQAMWKRNPGYFSPPPRNQYYPQNKAFADRVHQAQANAQRYIDEETGRTTAAQNLLYGVSADSTSGQYLASLGEAATHEREKLETTEARRKKLVVVSDILAIIFGLMARGIKINLEEVTGERSNPKSLSYILAIYIEQLRVWLLELLEGALGVDIDGNGNVGTVKNRLNNQQIGFQIEGQGNHQVNYTTPPPSHRNPIGFIHYQDNLPTSPVSSPDAIQWPPVATDVDYSKMEVEVLNHAYKYAKSSWHKWNTKEERGDGETVTNERHMAKWKNQMKAIESRLQELTQGLAALKG